MISTPARSPPSRRTDALRPCPLRRPGISLVVRATRYHDRHARRTVSLDRTVRDAGIMTSELARGWPTCPSPSALAPAPGFARSPLRRLRVVLLVLLGFLAVLYLLQDRMIFPGTATQGTPAVGRASAARHGAAHLTTADGERVVALFGPALWPDGRPHPDPGLAAGAASTSTATRCAWPMPSPSSTASAASA